MNTSFTPVTPPIRDFVLTFHPVELETVVDGGKRYKRERTLGMGVGQETTSRKPTRD